MSKKQKEETEYGRDIEIDRDRLDTEWVRQASTMMKYLDLSSRLDRKQKAAKERIDYIKAKKYIEIKSRLMKTEGGKKAPTEGQINSLVIVSEEVQEAINDFLVASKRYSAAQSAVKALEHKRKALENLVQLYLSGYWSEPRSDKDSRFDVDSSLSRRQQKALSSKKKNK